MSAAAPTPTPVTVQAAPQITYAAPQVTYLATPSASVTYAGAPVTYAAAPQEPMVAAPQYVMPQQPQQQQPLVSYVVPAPAEAAAGPQPVNLSYVAAPPQTYTMQSAGPTYAALQPAPCALQPAPSMVAYPGISPAYYPQSVREAWNNHFSAFGEQNLDKIMLDYDETSVVRLFTNNTKEKKEFRGTAQIKDMFAGLFAELADKTTLQAPIQDVDEEPKTVFLIWECPGCGYKTATDTFVFGVDFKIKRQNIVVTKEAVAPAISSAVSAPSSAKKSSKKTSKKKKSKGLC